MNMILPWFSKVGNCSNSHRSLFQKVPTLSRKSLPIDCSIQLEELLSVWGFGLFKIIFIYLFVFFVVVLCWRPQNMTLQSCCFLSFLKRVIIRSSTRFSLTRFKCDSLSSLFFRNFICLNICAAKQTSTWEQTSHVCSALFVWFISSYSYIFNSEICL